MENNPFSKQLLEKEYKIIYFTDLVLCCFAQQAKHKEALSYLFC